METVKGAIQTAEKVIWGDQPRSSGEEPISGVKGEGTPSDPYDAGNVTGNEPISGVKGQGTASDPYDAGNVSQASNPEPVNFQEESKPTGGSMSHATGRHPVAPTSGIVPVGANLPGAAESSLSGAPSGPLDTSYGASDRSKPIVPSEISTKPDTIDHSGGGIKPALPQESTQGSSQTASSVNQIEPLKLTQTPDTSDHPSFIGSENKSYLAQATTASALGGTEKLNTDPIDAPSTGVRAPGETAYPKSPYPKEPVVERDESSTSEPRPTAPEVMNAYHKQLPSRSRPIDEKEPSTKFTDDHSGIRTEGETPGERAEGTQKPLSADSSKEQTKPQEPKDPEATRQPETENIVRSTGFAAEGGDFDASEPGAGKEADRLLEEKHKQDPNSTLPAKSSAGGHKDKPDDHHGGLWTGSHKSGLTMHKVKEKLHLGKHHGS